MKYKFDTLYARDSKGKILEWSVEVSGNATQIDIKTAYGEYEGGLAVRWQRDIKAKNIGKSNETKPFEQAILDCESKIRDKKKKGYMTFAEAKDLEIAPVIDSLVSFFVTADALSTYQILDKVLPKNRTDAKGNVKPMKAQQYYRSKKNWVDSEGNLWDDRKHYYLQNPFVIKEKGAILAKFPCIGQPKINGVRALIQLTDNGVTITSKEGLEYRIPQIEDFFTINSDIFLYKGQSLVLDGELYIHREALQDIASAVKKVSLMTGNVVFKLFDIAIDKRSNENRWDIIKIHIKPKLDIHLQCPIELVQTVTIISDTHAQNYTDHCIKLGYEGAMLKELTLTKEKF